VLGIGKVPSKKGGGPVHRKRDFEELSEGVEARKLWGGGGRKWAGKKG
jgi:hypothetical protein